MVECNDCTEHSKHEIQISILSKTLDKLEQRMWHVLLTLLFMIIPLLISAGSSVILLSTRPEPPKAVVNSESSGEKTKPSLDVKDIAYYRKHNYEFEGSHMLPLDLRGDSIWTDKQ